MKPYPTSGPNLDAARIRTRPESSDTPTRHQPDEPVATVKGPVVFTGSEHRHLAGIPVIGYRGATPNTQPGRTNCTECGRRSGEWHHKACSWEGTLP